MDYFEIIKQRAKNEHQVLGRNKHNINNTSQDPRLSKNLYPLSSPLDDLILNEPLPLVFISHCHADQALAEGLIDLLEAAISIEPQEIRASSVPGCKLQAGCHVDDQLHSEIAQAKVVLLIVTKQVSDSPYVLFELGAAWGLNKRIFPLTTPDVDLIDLDRVLGPIASLHRLDLANNSECHQVVTDVCKAINRHRKTEVDSRIAVRVERLQKLAKATHFDSALQPDAVNGSFG
jgi:hypothetical protein